MGLRKGEMHSAGFLFTHSLTHSLIQSVNHGSIYHSIGFLCPGSFRVLLLEAIAAPVDGDFSLSVSVPLDQFLSAYQVPTAPS